MTVPICRQLQRLFSCEKSTFSEAYFLRHSKDIASLFFLFFLFFLRGEGGGGGGGGWVVNIPNTNGGKLLSRPLYSCKSHWTDSALELCILLCLIPGARGEHLTSLLSWIAA